MRSGRRLLISWSKDSQVWLVHQSRGIGAWGHFPTLDAAERAVIAEVRRREIFWRPRRRTVTRGGSTEETLMLNRSVDPQSGCWQWTGPDNDKGYGALDRKYVHRVAHELWIGPIPEGYFVDHVAARGCVHTNCFNPAHLEAVTPRENVIRGVGPTAANAAKEICKRGHDLTDPANVRTNAKGHRWCRTCAQIAERARVRPRGKP